MGNRRSQIDFVFTLFGACINGKSSLQPVVALSTTKVEYLAMIEAAKEGVWLLGLVYEFGIFQDNICIKCDNQGTIQLFKHGFLK